MQIHEQIYTSASKLLDPGQSDLGVVAESSGFPRPIASQLSGLASYRLLAELPVDVPQKHPARIVAMARGKNNEYFSVSRIVFAGADHSGRTTPLAHHVLVLRSDADGASRSLGQVIRGLQSHFVNHWSQDPVYYDPPRAVTASSDDGGAASMGAVSPDEWARILGFIAGRFAAEVNEKALSIVFVVSQEDREASLELLAAICDCMLPDKQASLSFQSHVTSTADVIGRPSVVVTYPHSKYLAEVQTRPESRRPVTIDLTHAGGSAIANVGFAEWVEKQIARHASPHIIRNGLTLREAIHDIDDRAHPNAFEETLSLYQALNSRKALQHVDEIGMRAQQLSSISTSIRSLISQWTAAAVRAHFKTRQADSDWCALMQILGNAGWPEPARQLCFAAITKEPLRSFPFFFANDKVQQISVLTNKVNEMINANPGLVADLLQSSPQCDAACRRYIERRLISGEVPMEPSRQLTQMLMQTGDVSEAHQAARSFLVSPVQTSATVKSSLGWLESVSCHPNLLGSLLEGSELPASLASHVRSHIRPQRPGIEPLTAAGHAQNPVPPPMPTADHPTGTALNFAVPTLPASSAMGPRRTTLGARTVMDPRPLLKWGGIACAAITLVGGSAVGVGVYFSVASLKSPMAMTAVGFGVLCLGISATAFVLFDNNRNLKKAPLLRYFGLISVGLLALSSIILAWFCLYPLIAFLYLSVVGSLSNA